LKEDDDEPHVDTHGMHSGGKVYQSEVFDGFGEQFVDKVGNCESEEDVGRFLHFGIVDISIDETKSRESIGAQRNRVVFSVGDELSPE